MKVFLDDKEIEIEVSDITHRRGNYGASRDGRNDKSVAEHVSKLII